MKGCLVLEKLLIICTEFRVSAADAKDFYLWLDMCGCLKAPLDFHYEKFRLQFHGI